MGFKNTRKKSSLSAKKQCFFVKRLKENNSQDEICEKKIISEFRGIKNRKWIVFRVSPIHNFSNNLKFYEKKMDEEMNSKKREASDICYKSKFSLNKNFSLNDQYFEVLQVKLIKNGSETAYLGLLILWSDSKSKLDGSNFLPMLLVEGKTHEKYTVHSFLCKMFDCDIQPVTFSFYALISFFVKLLEIQRNTIDVSQEQVIMEYKVANFDVSDNIKISLNLQDAIFVLAIIMDSLREKYQEITPECIAFEFYKKILNHIYHIFKMDMTYAELQKIIFPDAFLTTDGQLKISTDDATVNALMILAYFTPLDAVVNL